MKEKKTIEERFSELMTFNHAKVVQLLYAKNPLAGYTPENIGKIEAAEKLLRLEYSGKVFQEWRERELMEDGKYL